MLTATQTKLLGLYLDYTNNYLTVAAFSEHHGISADCATTLLAEGAAINDLVNTLSTPSQRQIQHSINAEIAAHD